MENDFAVFILSHGRPNKVATFNTLRRLGYTGKIFIIVDDWDEMKDQYKKLYGEQVIVFDKVKAIEKSDSGDNFDDYRSPLYARNVCFDIAGMLNLKYFLELDDDYNYFAYCMDHEGAYCRKICFALDRIFLAMINFLNSTGVDCIAFAQTGDFIGGQWGTYGETIMLTRKIMNSFFCVVSEPFRFLAKMNDDVTTYVVEGSRGRLFFTTTAFVLSQVDTQTNKGGLTDLYLKMGTYVKSFYTVMFAPSCTKISLLCTKNPRLHHCISWDHAVPKILDEKWKK